MEPNLDRLRLWEAALLSGKYPQTTGVLMDREGFCCLGVACVVARENGGPEYGDEFLREHAFLPTDVAEWFGLGSNIAAVPLKVSEEVPATLDGHPGVAQGGRECATSLNDGYRQTFGQIAGHLAFTFNL